MPFQTRHVVKNGDVRVVSKEADYQAALAEGYVLTTVPNLPENDPQDLQNAAVNRAKGTLKLPVLAAAPAGPNVVGEVYVATGGVLKVCTVAGSPGTWVSVGAQT